MKLAAVLLLPLVLFAVALELELVPWGRQWDYVLTVAVYAVVLALVRRYFFWRI